MTFSVIYETDEFVAIDKPAGILSQKDKSGDDDLAAVVKAAWIAEGREVPFLAPVHRLDRNVSGLILLAKTKEGARKLTEQMQEGAILRSYLAIVKGDPGESGEYDFRLEKNNATNEVRVSSNGEEALTQFLRLQKMGSTSLVGIRIFTGRSHQIRVHFSHAGHALIGDRKYAKKPWSELSHRPALHAFKLEMMDEEGEETQIVAPAPQDFRDLLQKLGGDVKKLGR